MPGADHGHLQRGGGDVELADRRQRGLGRVGVLREPAQRLPGEGVVEVVEAALAEPELLRGLPEHVCADLHADVPEGDVAGDLERPGEGDRVAAAGAAALVDQVGAGLRQVEARAAGHL